MPATYKRRTYCTWAGLANDCSKAAVAFFVFVVFIMVSPAKGPSRGSSGRGDQIHPHQNPLGVGEVADDLAYRWREFTHQGGDGQNLVVLGQMGRLHQVNHLNLVAPFQVLFTEALEVGKRRQRSGRLPRYVESQFPNDRGFRTRRFGRTRAEVLSKILSVFKGSRRLQPASLLGLRTRKGCGYLSSPHFACLSRALERAQAKAGKGFRGYLVVSFSYISFTLFLTVPGQMQGVALLIETEQHQHPVLCGF